MNLLEGEFMCCGTLCNKRLAQEHINRMQRAINHAYVALAMPISAENKQQLLLELKALLCKTQ